MYNYSKSSNISFLVLYKSIYENAVDDSSMNMSKAITKAIEEVKMVIEQLPDNDESANDIPLNTTDIDNWKNIAAFEELYNLKKKADTSSGTWDWSTEAVGSLFIKNLNYLWKKCQDTVMKLVNDHFILPKQNLSLPNIALIFAANDYRLINTKSHIEGNPQLNDYLGDCLIDVLNSSVFAKETEKLDFGARYSIHQDTNQYVEPSPCLNLNKFPRCSKYCTWHQLFFEDVQKEKFLTLMTYAIPQRKIR